MKKTFIYLLLIVIVTSCATTRKVETPLPVWLKQRPASSEYFLGIGSSLKNGTPNSYMSAARKDALADLASGIAVNISGVSVLAKTENNRGIYESFTEQIKASSEDFLYDAELVEQFQNDTHYWCYYRIRKSEYYRIKAEKKREATEIALGKYKTGLQADKEGDISRAVKFYIQGLSAIRAYLAESTKIEDNGKSIDIAGELFNKLSDLASRINVYHDMRSLSVKEGSSVEPYKLTFNVIDRQTGKKLSGIPVKFKFTAGYLPKDKDMSDVEGKVSTYIDRLISVNDTEIIEVTPDFDELISLSTTDLIISGLMKGVISSGLKFRLNVTKPTVWLIYSGDVSKANKNTIATYFSENNIQMSYSEERADHVVVFSIDEGSNVSGQGYESYLHLTVELRMFKGNGKVIYDNEIRERSASVSDNMKVIDRKFTGKLKGVVLPMVIRKLKGL
ncbi:MAG: LPP20 family lipoprotein [Bacteroidales bacterium]|jgi:hypothetical protein|nr:LPP20 family lipoprotein [Bacteroidales bacterium]